MKTKHYILTVVLAVPVAFVAGFFIGKGRMNAPSALVAETRDTIVDTIRYHAPIPHSELTSGTRRYILPTYRFLGKHAGSEPRQHGEKDSIRTDSACTDSAVVELPIVQRHYADSTYEAWVSGPVDPRLDSIRVFAPTTIISKREWTTPKRWHIGITAGYGFGIKGVQPYIGVGVTYSLFSF